MAVEKGKTGLNETNTETKKYSKRNTRKAHKKKIDASSFIHPMKENISYVLAYLACFLLPCGCIYACVCVYVEIYICIEFNHRYVVQENKMNELMNRTIRCKGFTAQLVHICW